MTEQEVEDVLGHEFLDENEFELDNVISTRYDCPTWSELEDS